MTRYCHWCGRPEAECRGFLPSPHSAREGICAECCATCLKRIAEGLPVPQPAGLVDARARFATDAAGNVVYLLPLHGKVG